MPLEDPGALDDAVYVPPAPQEMNECLKHFATYLAQPPKTPELVQAGLLHYQFEAIHPFGDGNGRIGRLLIILFLMERGVLSAPLLYLSAYFERRRTEYYRHLLRTSENGDYDGWLQFFLKGISTQAREATTKATRLVDLHKRYRETLGEMKATAGAFTLVDKLFGNPYLTIPQAVESLQVTFPTAQRAIEGYLVKAGILELVTDRYRTRLFVAREILGVLDE
jgi:Fic family protein